MNTDRLFGLLLGATALVFASGAGWTAWLGGVEHVDRAAPTLPARLLAGGELAFDAQPVVLHVWLPGCGICAREVPALEAVRQRHPDVRHVDLSIIQSPGETTRSARLMGLTGELAVTTGNALAALDLNRVPATVWIRSDGQIVAVGEGALSERVLERETAALR